MLRIRAALPLFAAPVDELHAYSEGVCGHPVRAPGRHRRLSGRAACTAAIAYTICTRDSASHRRSSTGSSGSSMMRWCGLSSRFAGVTSCSPLLSPMKRNVVEC
jgi:hypothetical protein